MAVWILGHVIAEGNEQFAYSFEGYDWGTEAFKTFAVESRRSCFC